MGLIVSKKEDIDKYFESERLGQSSIKKLTSGLDSFLTNRVENKEMFYEEKGHFIIGSAVDCLLTGHKDQFDLEYHKSLIVKPTDTIMSIVQQVFSMIKDQARLEEQNLSAFILDNGNDLQIYGETVLYCCNEHNYQSRWKDETRVKKIIDEGDPYFKELIESDGKQILSLGQVELIDSIKASLTNSSVTGKYFDRKLQDSNPNIDFYYQLPIYFEHREVECKALLDMVAVVSGPDGEIITIIPYDLKTMSGNTLHFPSSMKTRRYDIQAAWYTLALTKHFNVAQDKINPFTFIVESTTIVGTPLVFVCTPSLLTLGRYGRPKLTIGSKDNALATPYDVKWELKGYESLLDDFIWYQENGMETERKVVENNGVLIMDWNGVVDREQNADSNR